jgi:hypothetical protein
MSPVKEKGAVVAVKNCSVVFKERWPRALRVHARRYAWIAKEEGEIDVGGPAEEGQKAAAKQR